MVVFKQEVIEHHARSSEAGSWFIRLTAGVVGYVNSPAIWRYHNDAMAGHKALRHAEYFFKPIGVGFAQYKGRFAAAAIATYFIARKGCLVYNNMGDACLSKVYRCTCTCRACPNDDSLCTNFLCHGAPNIKGEF